MIFFQKQKKYLKILESIENDSINDFINSIAQIDNNDYYSHTKMTQTIGKYYGGDFHAKILRNVENFTIKIERNDNNIGINNLIIHPRYIIILYLTAIYFNSYNIVVFLHDLIDKYNIDQHNDLNNIDITIKMLHNDHIISRFLMFDTVDDTLGILHNKIIKLGYLLHFLNIHHNGSFDFVANNLRNPERLLCHMLHNENIFIPLYYVPIFDKCNAKLRTIASYYMPSMIVIFYEMVALLLHNILNIMKNIKNEMIYYLICASILKYRGHGTCDSIKIVFFGILTWYSLLFGYTIMRFSIQNLSCVNNSKRAISKVDENKNIICMEKIAMILQYDL